MTITVNMQVIASAAAVAVGHAARMDEVSGFYPVSAQEWARQVRASIQNIRKEMNEAEAELDRLFPRKGENR